MDQAVYFHQRTQETQCPPEGLEGSREMGEFCKLTIMIDPELMFSNAGFHCSKFVQTACILPYVRTFLTF